MNINNLIRFAIFIPLCHLLQGCAPEILDNPTVDTNKLPGKYKNSTQFLSIFPDGTYLQEGAEITEKGTWKISDSFIVLSQSKSQPIYVKVTEIDTNYHLLILKDGQNDPDSWDWSMSMTK